MVASRSCENCGVVAVSDEQRFCEDCGDLLPELTAADPADIQNPVTEEPVADPTASGLTRERNVTDRRWEPLLTSDPPNIDSYGLKGRLGAGGFGVVYAAEDASGSEVAIKLLRPELSDDSGLRSRLAREAEALRRVQGDRTAQVIDVVTQGDRAYIVMELVDGETLDKQIAAGGALQGPLLWFAAQGLIAALQDIHSANIVHRDLKPSNVIYGPDGIKVLDFGISIVAEETSLTQTGAFVGTAAWISPEQILGKPITEATDVFNFGLVMAYAATGIHPYGEGRSDALMYRISNTAPELQDIARPLRDAIEKCLQREPEQRPTVAALAEFFATDGVAPLEDGTQGTIIVEPQLLDEALATPKTATSDGTRAVRTPFEPPIPAAPKRKLLAVALAAIIGIAVVAGAVISQNSETSPPIRNVAAPDNGGSDDGNTDPPDNDTPESGGPTSQPPATMPPTTEPPQLSPATTSTTTTTVVTPGAPPPQTSTPQAPGAPQTTSTSTTIKLALPSTTTTTLPAPNTVPYLNAYSSYSSSVPNGTIISLSWGSSGDNVSYYLYESSGGVNGPWGSPIRSCQCYQYERTKTSATSGSTLHYQVIAERNGKQSEPKKTSVVVSDKPAPSSPTNIAATQTSTTSPYVSLSWNAPTTTACASGSYSCPSYRIEKSTNQLTWSTVTSSTTSRSKSSIYVSPWGTTTHFRIRATGSNQTPGPWSITSITPSTKPDKPNSVTACRIGASSDVRVSWTAPTSNGGSTITGYKITGGINTQTATTSPKTVSMSSKSGTLYVYSKNKNGDSNYASKYVSSSTYTTPTCAGTAIPTLDTPGVSSITTTGAAVSIPSKPSNFDTYGQTFGVYVFTNSSTKSTSSSYLKTTCGVGAYSSRSWGSNCTVNGLTANTTYYARTYITGTTGDNNWSAARSFRTAAIPAVPTLDTPGVSSITTTGAAVSIPSKPSNFDTYGQTFGVYVFTNSSTKSTSSSYLKTTCGVGAYSSRSWGSNCTVNGLTANTTYYARTYITDNQGRNNWSAAGSFRTAAIPALPTFSAPGVSSITTTGAAVSIPSKPSNFDTYGQTFGVYVFTNSSTKSTSSSYLKTTCGVGAYSSRSWGSNCTVSGLIAGSTYYARYYLTDTQGRNGWSSAKSFATGTGPLPELVAPTLKNMVGNKFVANFPAAPAGWNVANCAMTKFSLFATPTATSGALWDHGDDSCSSGQGTPWGNDYFFDIELTPGTTYYLRYYLKDQSGKEKWSSALEITVALPPLFTYAALTEVPEYSETEFAVRMPYFQDFGGVTPEIIKLYLLTSPTATSGSLSIDDPGQGNLAYFASTSQSHPITPGVTYYARIYMKDVYGRETWSPPLSIKTKTPAISTSWLKQPSFRDNVLGCPAWWSNCNAGYPAGFKNTSTSVVVQKPYFDTDLNCDYVEKVEVRLFNAESYRQGNGRASYMTATTGDVARQETTCQGGGQLMTFNGLSPSSFYAARILVTTVWGEEIWSIPPESASDWNPIPYMFTYTAPRNHELDFLGVPQITGVSATDFGVVLPSQPQAWAQIEGNAELCLAVFETGNANRLFSSQYASTPVPTDGPTWNQANGADNTLNVAISNCWTAKGSSTALGGTNQVPWGSTFNVSSSSNIRRPIQSNSIYYVYWYLKSTDGWGGLWGDRFWYGYGEANIPVN